MSALSVVNLETKSRRYGTAIQAFITMSKSSTTYGTIFIT